MPERRRTQRSQRTQRLMRFATLATFASLAFLSESFSATPIRVMLLDGSNNHDWKSTSPVVLKILDETGMFKTTRVTIDNADLGTFNPDWSQHDVVVLNYNTGINAA